MSACPTGGDVIKRRQRIVHHLLSFAHDRVEVAMIPEALRIDLVNVLGAGWPGREPAVVGDHLEAADRCVVTRGTSQLSSNRLAGKPGRRNGLRRWFCQP